LKINKYSIILLSQKLKKNIMSDQNISSLLAVSLISGPMALTAPPVSEPNVKASSEVSTPRPSVRRMMHLLSQPPVRLPMGTYVGELQERWQFPSDHLAIGMTFDDLHIASWNILDAEAMDWVTKENSQGISRSMIAEEHIYIGDSELTIRDQHVAQIVRQMLIHPTHPRSILGLQECSDAFLEELLTHLPANFELIADKGNAMIIDRNVFEIVDVKAVAGVYSASPNRTFQDITLRRLDNGELLRFLNTHIPGDPQGPGRYEFARYLADTFNPLLPTIALGDMNFNEVEMSDALRQAFVRGRQPFSVYSPYCTNISPYIFISKAIDHFLVYNPEKSSLQLDQPDEVIPGLQKIVDLLSEGPKIAALAS
jgi:endonuclease/exonuclease/phosphatase family metal-dependent hydrolase